MHGDQNAVFIVVVMLIAAVAAIVMSLIHGRQRLAEIKAKGGGEGGRRIHELTEENAGLRGKVVRLEDRIATLERIVTDPAERTAREIESLR